MPGHRRDAWTRGSHPNGHTSDTGLRRERPYAEPPKMAETNRGRTWWQDAVFYQVYPLSYQDSNDDGFGDLRGVISRIPYLADTLGIDAIWLSPFYRSPMRDWGYDVSDHTDRKSAV